MLKKDVELKGMVSFKTEARAKYFAEYSSLKELERITRMPAYRESQIFHLGGGSNVLFFGTYDGMVLHSTIRGITEYKKNDEETYIIAGAGEKWSDLVDWTIDHGYSGMECMAEIPGEVGASPVQNVGAFGAEAKDVIFSVECYDTTTGQTVRLRNEECGFAYRDSRFKKEWKGRYYVLRVSFKLKKSEYAENFRYEAIRKFAESRGGRPTTREVRDEVVRLRSERLPDPTKIGSAGSFFKNPIIHKNFYADEVLRRRPDVPCHKVDDIRVKLPAGWLIEQAGMSGRRVGDAEVYPKNCLVIENRGNATPEDIRQLAREVEREVNRQFGVRLEPEVNYIDTSIEVRVLGTGTSKGVPEVGCECHVCTSDDPKDRRLRTSVMVKTMGQTLLIDASPDFREQALRNHINHIDALLLTHIHYDHVGGIDDLRPFCLNGDIPVFCRQDVLDDLKRRIDYCFRETKYPGVPKFDPHVIDGEPFNVNGIRVTPIKVNHGKLPIFGYRIGDFAYVTDCKTMEEEEKEKLRGLDVLIINALRHRDHFAHLTIEEALELIKELKPKRAYLTHLCHEAGTDRELRARLPEGVEPAWDGMEIRC